MKNNKGFTLAEILIAASVFVIISVVVFRLMTRSRENAEITTRKSQMTGTLRAALDSIKKDFHKTQVYNPGTGTMGPDSAPSGAAGEQFYIRLSEKFSKISGSVVFVFSLNGEDPASSNQIVTYQLDQAKKTLTRNGRVIADNIKEFIISHDADLDGNIDPQNENEAKIFVKLTLEQRFKGQVIKMEQTQVVTSPGVLSVIKNTSKSLQSRADDF